MPRVPPVTTATRATPLSLQQFLLRGRAITRSSCQTPALCRKSGTLSNAEHRPWRRASRARSAALDAHRDAHAAADAERGETLLGIAPLHLVEERDQHARAGRADRMADRDRAAVDVDPGRIPAEILVDGASLRRESLIRLDEVEILDLPAGLLES